MSGAYRILRAKRVGRRFYLWTLGALYRRWNTASPLKHINIVNNLANKLFLPNKIDHFTVRSVIGSIDWNMEQNMGQIWTKMSNIC